MKGFFSTKIYQLNLLQISLSLPIIHVINLGNSLSDSEIWQYAMANDLVIVTKDVDFSDRIIISNPPPRVVHIRFRNMRTRDFHSFLKGIWSEIEELLEGHKLVNVIQLI